MSEIGTRAAGWYPDPATGGTRYWDGQGWSGDTRPPRRSFAAEAHEDGGVFLIAIGAFFLILSMFSNQINDGSVPSFGLFFVLAVVGIAAGAWGVYLYRGQGPTTQAVESRIAAERAAAEKARRRAAVINAIPFVGRVARELRGADDSGNAMPRVVPSGDSHRSLQALGNLKTARSITEQEFRRARDIVIASPMPEDAVSQLEKLADLYRAGVLDDGEFAAAKARVLGL